MLQPVFTADLDPDRLAAAEARAAANGAASNAAAGDEDRAAVNGTVNGPVP
jgi:hypothetical protein